MGARHQRFQVTRGISPHGYGWTDRHCATSHRDPWRRTVGYSPVIPARTWGDPAIFKRARSSFLDSAERITLLKGTHPWWFGRRVDGSVICGTHASACRRGGTLVSLLKKRRLKAAQGRERAPL